MQRGTKSILDRSYRRFENWIMDHALPFWADTGQDAAGLGFVEHLTLEGRPADPGWKRVRVQARQIYVYANAALLGFPGAMEAAHNGYDFLTAHGWNPSGGFARSLGRAGGVHDAAVDLYDNAFVLFAMAWYARATGRSEPVHWAHRTLDWIESNMRTPHGEGFENALPRTGTSRLQNPHMHLLEACLALHETTGHARFAATADDLLILFEQKLFDRWTGTLAEYYGDDWSQPDVPCHRHIEPGHLFEWVWLLDSAQTQLEKMGSGLEASLQALYSFAVRHGKHACHGWIVDTLDALGRQVTCSGRLWPQTEAIKAHMALWRRGDEMAGLRAAHQLDVLQDRFLSDCVPGTWRDHLSPEGALIADRVPASSLYHLFMAYNELRKSVEPA